MSGTLRSVADENHVLYADTIPDWFDSNLRSAGFTNGIETLRGNFENVMIYTPTIPPMLSRVSSTVGHTTSPVSKVITLNIDYDSRDPYLSSRDISPAIDSVYRLSATNPDIIGVSLFHAHYLLKIFATPVNGSSMKK